MKFIVLTLIVGGSLLLGSCATRSPSPVDSDFRSSGPGKATPPTTGKERAALGVLISKRLDSQSGKAMGISTTDPVHSSKPIENPTKNWLQEFAEVKNEPAIEAHQQLLRLSEILDYQFYTRKVPLEELAQKLKEKNPTWLENLDYWLLEKLWEQHKYEEASRFATSLTKSNQALIQQRAQYLYDQYFLVRKASPQKIGVLLPKGAKNGERFLAALKLAMGQVEGQTSPFTFILKDEPETPEDFETRFKELVKDENVITIVGGLKSKSRTEIARLSNLYRVPFIFLGQKSRVTHESPYLFQYGLTNESQIRALVSHSRENNISKVAIVYPNDGFGVEAANLFWEEWLASGGEVVSAYTYHPQENDFQEIAAKMANKFDVTPRMAEFRKLQKDKLEKDPTSQKKILAQTPEELLPAQYDYEAIFIPDVTKSVAKITASLAYYGVRRLPILGTRLLANPEAFKLMGPMWAPHLLIPDSLYNQTESLSLYPPFFMDLKNKGHSETDQLEASAYEIAELLRSQIQQGVDSREAMTHQFRDQVKIKGLHSIPVGFDEYREWEPLIQIFRFNEDGRLAPASSLIY